MPSLLNPCDPDRLRRLAEDRLPPVEVTGLERHLERCARCREALDRLVDDDRCLLAVRRYLGADPTDPCEPAPVADESLDLLAPSDWPDSLGRIGNYEIKGVLGRGGMGVVLKAFDPALHRNVAIKVLSVSLATSGVARRRFLREARAAAAVVHEHVVAVYAVVESSGLPFLVMEYIPGRSLQERLDSQGALSLREVLRIGMQTASGLAAAHAQGLVHRDVKPANILLENGIERVRLTDFGLARAAADAAMTQSGIVAGTPHYMAPEQARGEPTDPRADLFSLGSTLYAACAGPSAVPRGVAPGRPPPRLRRRPAPAPRAESRCPRLAGNDHRPADGQGPGPAVPDRERGRGGPRPMPGSRPAAPGVAPAGRTGAQPDDGTTGPRAPAIGRGRGLRHSLCARGRSLGRPIARAGADPHLGAGHASSHRFEPRATGGRAPGCDRFR